MKTKTHKTQERFSKYVLGNYGRFAMVPVRGEGTELWDSEGKRYLDFATGIAVCALGHAHPAMTAALHEQGETLMHCSNLFQIPQQAELAELLVDKVMEAAGRCFFCNSGAEANETLVKLARRYGPHMGEVQGQSRQEILTFSKSFHGRTFGSMSATAQEKIHGGFQELLAGFTYLPFNDVEAFEKAISHKTAAVLLEPIQGEGGIHVASPEFLRAVAAKCEEVGALLFLDEVQCGVGRAGHLCGWKTIAPEIIPDAVSWAKGMGGGFPIGAAWIREKALPGDLCLTKLLGPGSHGTTYGGAPLASAVSKAVLEEIMTFDLSSHANAMGSLICHEIAAWKHPLIVEARGKGLLIGVELASAAPKSVEVVQACLDAGLLTVPAGAEVVRLLPPLNVKEEEVTEALGILKQVLDGLMA